MNLYHCMIELKSEAKARVFAQRLEAWLGDLRGNGLIGDWRLYRRKLGLASDRHTDFMLQIEVEDLAQLESTFRALSESGEEETYDALHQMIGAAHVGLYRPYPDPGQRERIALI